MKFAVYTVIISVIFFSCGQGENKEIEMDTQIPQQEEAENSTLLKRLTINRNNVLSAAYDFEYSHNDQLLKLKNTDNQGRGSVYYFNPDWLAVTIDGTDLEYHCQVLSNGSNNELFKFFANGDPTDIVNEYSASKKFTFFERDENKRQFISGYSCRIDNDWELKTVDTMVSNSIRFKYENQTSFKVEDDFTIRTFHFDTMINPMPNDLRIFYNLNPLAFGSFAASYSKNNISYVSNYQKQKNYNDPYSIAKKGDLSVHKMLYTYNELGRPKSLKILIYDGEDSSPKDSVQVNYYY